jgi:ABC-type spermidine/putrescine transport system permease subunit I
VLDRRATIDVEMVGLDDRVVTAAASLGAGGIRELRRR